LDLVYSFPEVQVKRTFVLLGLALGLALAQAEVKGLLDAGRYVEAYQQG